MNFFKKNKMLSLAILLTVIISAALIVMDVMAYFKFKAETLEIAKNVETIESATKKKPAPLKENMVAIDKDIQTLSALTRDLQRRFGKFYRIPLIHFAQAINTTEDDLLTAFRTYYEALPEEQQGDAAGKNDQDILDNFLKLYYLNVEDPSQKEKTAASEEKESEESDSEEKLTAAQQAAKDKIEDAVEVFGKEAAAITMGYDGNTASYLLEALGLPRSVQTNVFKKELNRVQKILLDKQIVPGVISEAEIIPMTFDAEELPPQREIYMACREMQIRTDLFKRLSKCKIREVRSLTAAILLAGEPIENDAYIKYTYTIEMNGQMDNIRNFINDLSDAYKDNLVYVVRDLSLKRPVPEDIELLTEISDGTKDADKKSTKTTKPSRNMAMPGMMSMQGQTPRIPTSSSMPKTAKSTKSNMSGMNVPGGMPMGMGMGRMSGMNGSKLDAEDLGPDVPEEYGQPVVGVDKSVDCILTVDFIMYVGEEVKRILPEETESETPAEKK